MEETPARVVNQLTSRRHCTLNESSFYSHENESHERWFWNGEGALGCRPSLGSVWDGDAELSYWLNQGVCMVGAVVGGWLGKGMEAAGWNGLGLTHLLQHLLKFLHWLKVSQFTRVCSLLCTLREPTFIYGNERWCWKEWAEWGRRLSMGVGSVAGW